MFGVSGGDAQARPGRPVIAGVESHEGAIEPMRRGAKGGYPDRSIADTGHGSAQRDAVADKVSNRTEGDGYPSSRL